MQKSTKQMLAKVLSASLIFSLMATPVNVDAAKKKIKLSHKSITITEGKSKKIKIKNINKKKIKKLTVKSTNKKVVKVKKIGNKKTAFKVTGKVVGNAKVKVVLKVKGQKKAKKFTLKVNVKAANTDVEKPDGVGEDKETITPTPEASSTPGISATPTAESTASPTAEPTVTATASPTTEPTVTATVSPTTEPTVTATVSPTVAPTETPGVTASPTPEPGKESNVQIDSVMVQENRNLIVIFNEVCDLTADDFIIKAKRTSQEDYGDALAIESIEKNDPFQYEIQLAPDAGNYIVNNGYAQVSVDSLTEAPLVAEDQFECETVTTTRQWVQQFTLGTAVGNIFMNLYNEDFVGALQYEVVGDMPDGLSYWLSGRNLYVRGTPEKVGIYKFVVDINDEVGNNLVYNCTYVVGDEENLYAVAAEQHILVGEEEEAYVNAIGGSGSYTYTKVEGDYDFTVDSEGEVTAEFTEAGTYKLYVDVSDAQNSNLTTRVEVVYHVEATCTLSGSVRDLGGSDIFFRGGGLIVYVIPQDREIRYKYYLYKPMASLEQTNSSFSIDVPAGVYDIRFESNYGSVYKVIKDVEVKDSFKSLGTVELPVCQVNLVAPNEDNLYQIYWRDEEGVLIGRNETFLVRPGTYTLHSDPDISPVMASLYDFTVTFSATEDSVYKLVTATPTGDRITEITLGNDVDVSLDSELQKWYKFKPSETGTYRFYSTGLDEDLWFDVYSDSQYYNSDYHYLTFTYTFQTCRGAQVSRSATLDAGTTYYISLDMIWDDTQDDFVFGVEKVE